MKAEIVYGRWKAMDGEDLTFVRGDDPEGRESVYPSKGLSIDDQFLKDYLGETLGFVIIDGVITEVRTR